MTSWGGTISVESVEGEGTSITVDLPLESATGAKEPEDISALDVVWLHLDKEVEEGDFGSLFHGTKAEFTMARNMQALTDQGFDFSGDRIYIFATENNNLSVELRAKVRKHSTGSKFLFFTASRSEKLGLVEPDT